MTISFNCNLAQNLSKKIVSLFLKKTRIFIGIQEVHKTTRWFDKSWFQHDVLGPAKWKTDRHVLDITVH